MLGDHLEIVIPTYGRAAALRRTLEVFADSPFADCRFTVVDNHSPDDTPSVCATLAPRFRELRHVRNPRNIGAPANVLRALELATAPYTWVIADDDDWDLSYCDDVIDAVRAGVDLVSVGGPGRDGWPAGPTTMRRLVAAGAPVHYVFSFLPNTIFRTELFDDAELREAYDMVGTLYPTMAFIHRQVERDARVHVSRDELVSRGGLGVPGSQLTWFVRWAQACAVIEDDALQRRELLRPVPGRGWAFWIGAIVLEERLAHPERARVEVATMLTLLPPRLRLLALPGASMLVLPRGLTLGLRTLVRQVIKRLGPGRPA